MKVLRPIFMCTFQKKILLFGTYNLNTHFPSWNFPFWQNIYLKECENTNYDVNFKKISTIFNFVFHFIFCKSLEWEQYVQNNETQPNIIKKSIIGKEKKTIKS
jgi:hypothetical protein